MPRSFKLPAIPDLKSPEVLVRAGLGILLLANLVASLFAFHIIGPSPESLNQSLIAARAQLQAVQQRLTRSRRLTANIDTGKAQSETFLANYMTDSRHTYSTILTQIRQTEKAAGMAGKEETIAPLDPIEGSDDLDMMTLSVNFEGTYSQLVKLVNLLDRSPRFLIIESMTAAPQPKGDILNANIKLNAFVKDDNAGKSDSAGKDDKAGKDNNGGKL